LLEGGAAKMVLIKKIALPSQAAWEGRVIIWQGF
jgi:hypothetical protein